MIVSRRFVWLLTIIGNLITFAVIAFAGIDNFFTFWWKSSLKYTIACLALAAIWYGLWIMRIKNKKEYANLSTAIANNTFIPDADKNLLWTECPQCHKDCYFFAENPKAPNVLTCWKCQHTFSDVFCNACDMGGDFVTDISKNPISWACPDCESIYPLPGNISLNPVKTMSKRGLPANVKLSYFARQMDFEKEQAYGTVWVMCSSLIAFTLAPPISHSFKYAFAKINLTWQTELVRPELLLLASLIFAAVIMLTCVSTWYGTVLYPIELAKRLKAWRSQTE